MMRGKRLEQAIRQCLLKYGEISVITLHHALDPFGLFLSFGRLYYQLGKMGRRGEVAYRFREGAPERLGKKARHYRLLKT